jgi:transposase-like protein
LLSGWLNRPLCRRYVLGIFDVAIVRLRDADGCRDQPVHWAFGWLADGECEPLGAWIEPKRGAECPLQMLEDLKGRGVERIWHVMGTDRGNLKERVTAAFTSTTVCSSVDRVLAEALAAARRRVLPSPERVAEHVREGLIRAIRRQGSFENEAAALDFIAGALQRAERRLDRERVIAQARPRQDPGAQMVPLAI